MSKISIVRAVMLMAAVRVPVLAQDAACPAGPGIPFGIAAYRCASCTVRQLQGETSVVFYSEPVIEEVATNSALQPGDVVEAVNRQPITTQSGSYQFARPWGPGSRAPLADRVVADSGTQTVGTAEITVRRGGQRIYVVVALTRQCVGAAAPSPSRSDSVVVNGTAQPGVGVPSAARSSVEVFPDSITAAAGVATVVVTVRDASGNPVPGAVVVVAAVGTNNTVTQPAGPTNQSGVAIGTISSSVPGMKPVLATANGTALSSRGAVVVLGPVAGGPVTGGPVTGPVAESAGRFGFALSCAPNCTRARAPDGTDYYQYDAFPAVAAVRSGGPAEVAGLRPGDRISAVDGSSIMDAEGALKLARSDRQSALGLHVLRNRSYVDLVLRVGAVPAGSAVPAQPRAGTPSAAMSTVQVFPDTISVGPGVATVAVTVRDSNGDPVVGAVVVVAATGTGNTVVQPAGVTDARGVATGVIASTVSGRKLISGVVNGSVAITRVDTVVVLPMAGGTVTGPTAVSAGKFGFSLACSTSCARAQAPDGAEYYRYDGFPSVAAILAGGPAETAGLRVGDRISAVDGRSILESDGALELATSDRRPALMLHVLRDRAYVDLLVRVP